MLRLFWRLFNFSIDDCDGTGDHENYFKDITDAYEIDGTKYTNCRKKAVSYRSKDEHKPLSRLIEYVFVLLNQATGRYLPFFQQQLLDKKEIIDPKYSWVAFYFWRFLFSQHHNSLKMWCEKGVLRKGVPPVHFQSPSF